MCRARHIRGGASCPSSLELNEDQIRSSDGSTSSLRTWSAPPGREWDEKEETPWPIIKEAAGIGLYSFDFVAQCFSDPTGLLMCLVNEEMSLG